MVTISIFSKAVALGEPFGLEVAHAAQVSRLALDLFDQLQPLHRMGNTERIWLRAAALLHDVGKAQNPREHHKVARDIIINSPELPFRWEERLLIALIARYHRGPLPRDGHAYYCDLDPEARNDVRKLAALLRLADSLDKGRSGLVAGLRCTIRPQSVLIGVESRDLLSIGKVMSKADLFQRVFERSVVVRVEIVREYPHWPLEFDDHAVYAMAS